MQNIQPTTKNIYQKIVEIQTKKYIISGEIMWNIKANQDLPWKNIWKNTFWTYNIPYENNLFYKILHNVITVNERIYKYAKNKNGITPICDTCNKENESIEHAFFLCLDRKLIWKEFEGIFKKLNTNHKTKAKQCILGLSAMDGNKNTRKLIMTITTSILNETWKARNIKKHNKKFTKTEEIIQNVRNSLKEIINIHFNKHKKQNTLTEFEAIFAIGNALCKIENNTVVFHF